MSAKDPYLLRPSSPKRLKNLVLKFPQTLKVFENIKDDVKLDKDIYFTDQDTADILVELIVGELQKFELIKTSSDNSCGYEALFSRIALNQESVSREEENSFVARRLVETAEAVKLSDPSKRVAASMTEGSLSIEDYNAMITEVFGIFDRYREKEDGPVKYKLSFASKEV